MGLSLNSYKTNYLLREPYCFSLVYRLWRRKQFLEVLVFCIRIVLCYCFIQIETLCSKQNCMTLFEFWWSCLNSDDLISSLMCQIPYKMEQINDHSQTAKQYHLKKRNMSCSLNQYPSCFVTIKVRPHSLQKCNNMKSSSPKYKIP